MEEFRNPTSSHYDRETIALLRGNEATKEIVPGGKPLVETTTGSSGASLAWMCRVLDFKCRIWIPGDMPAARIEQIRAYGADVQFAPSKRYIGGLVSKVEEFTRDRALSRRYVFTNHSIDEEFGPPAIGQIATEAIAVMAQQDDLTDLQRQRPDYFVSALGNGISARGIADVLHPLGTTVVGMEPYESPDVLRVRFPEQFAEMYPDRDDGPTRRHEIYGTGPGQDSRVVFPNVTAVMPLLDQILLPQPSEWKSVQLDLMDREARHVGNSSAACVWAALKLAQQVPRGSTIFTLFYDAWWRYLPMRSS